MTQSRASLRIGTRGSPLAVVQARMVRTRLAAAAGLEEGAIELVVIRTTGDPIQDRPLAEEGGKGLFTKEIEEALLDERVDLAVHSAKDMPTILPAGLVLAACLEREDPRDVFISRKAHLLSDLPPGASLGTASLRRQAIAKRARSEEHTSELQSLRHLVCRLLLEKKNKITTERHDEQGRARVADTVAKALVAARIEVRSSFSVSRREAINECHLCPIIVIVQIGIA